MFDHEALFRKQLDALRSEGRYRFFADLERRARKFPRAFHHQNASDVTIWCSNDYLGMGQHTSVLSAMHEAIDRAGAGARGSRIHSVTHHLPSPLTRALTS